MVWWIRHAIAQMEPSSSCTLHTRKHSSHWYVPTHKDFAFFFSFSDVSELQPPARKKHPMNKDDNLKEHKLYRILERRRLIYTTINQSNLLLWWFFLSVLYYLLGLKARKKGKVEEGGEEGSMKLTSQRPTCIPFDQTTPKHEVCKKIKGRGCIVRYRHLKISNKYYYFF